MDFDNIQSPTELTEEKKKAIELQRKMQKTVILSVTAGVAVTLGLGIVTMLLLLHFGVFTFNKNALNKDKAGETGSSGIVSTDDKLNEIKNVMSGFYFGDVDGEAAEDAVCKAYVSAYGDQYSVYYTADEYKDLTASIEGESFFGIGVRCRESDGKGISVLGFTEGSPSEKAGLKEGDLIVEADGHSLVGIDADTAISHLRGEEGTKVHLKVQRGEEILEFDVERVKLDETSVKSAVLDDGITGYIRISEFTNKTTDQFVNELNSVKDEGATRIVVDLRNNTGGVVSSALGVLDILVGEGDYGEMRFKDGSTGEFKGTGGKKTDLPYVLLVNQYSASASEILAASVKDYGTAKIIGTKTFGKGITQRVKPLSDGSAIKYTDAQMYSPKGETWHEKGIEPDIEIELKEDDTEDVQLNAALDYLNTL